MLRSLYTLLLLLAVTTATAHAQSYSRAATTDITLLGGWQYWGTKPVYGALGYQRGDLHLNADVNYGAEITKHITPYKAVQVSYTYQSTDLVYRGSSAGSDLPIAPTAVQHIQAYAVRTMPQGDGLSAFVKGGLGASVYSPENYESVWRFSVGVGLGVEKRVGERVAVKLTQRLLFPIQYTTGGFYFGSGGSGISVSGGSTVIQGDTSLGLTFQLGR